jgi:small subunit ribosomal protein S20
LPHHESTKKRLRQDEKRRARNRAVKSEVKSVSKKVAGASSPEEAEQALREAASTIDRAAKKGIIHWKTAARKKSKLARQARPKNA